MENGGIGERVGSATRPTVVSQLSLSSICIFATNLLAVSS